MKSQLRLLFAIVVLSISSCGRGVNASSTSVPSPLAIGSTPEPTKRATTSVPVPTVTRDFTTQTVTTEPAPDSALPQSAGTPVAQRLTTRCLNVQSEPSTVQDGQGILILGARDASVPTVAFDLATGTAKPMPEAWYFWNWTVSPSGNLFGRFVHPPSDEENAIGDQLEILSQDGELLVTVPLEGRFGGWLDNQFIKLYVPWQQETNKFSLVVVDIFTGDQRVFPPVFPDLHPYIYLYGSIPPFFPIEVYDPGLTQVVYPYSEFDQNGMQLKEGFRLWDFGQSRVLVDLPALIGHSGPAWSADGRQFAVTALPSFPDGYPELYSVDRYGHVIQLTDLQAANGVISNNSLSWSPDGRHLAFWLKAGLPERADVETLAVLDVTTLELVDYCVPGGVPVGASAPTWSDDGRMLVIESSPEPQSSHVVLVDIERDLAVTIGENQIPVFWLQTLPPIWTQTP